MIDLSGYKKLVIDGVDLKKLSINGIDIWTSGYKNLVPTSIDTDGNIFNGSGYMDGYTLSLSTAGYLTAQSDTTVTGYISCKSTDVIRMSGLTFRPVAASASCFLTFYDSDFTLLGSIGCQRSGASNTGYENTPTGIVGALDPSFDTPPSELNGVTTFDHYYFASGEGRVAYFRLNGYGGSGANLIVTVNEEI